MRRVVRKWLAASALWGALAMGCGPVESTSIKWQVESRLARAEKLGGDRYAPYEMTAARLYLHKGKEEAGYADFEAAIDYLHKARLLAKQAEEKSEAGSKLDPLRPSELKGPPRKQGP